MCFAKCGAAPRESLGTPLRYLPVRTPRASGAHAKKPKPHSSDSRGAAPHFAKHIEPYLDARSSKIVEAVAVAAEGLGFSPLEVALTWVRDAPGVTSALIGARTGAQLRGVLKSEEIALPDIVRTALDEISL